MQIPIIIISKDRVSTLEKLIDQLLLLGYTDITILDMASTYEPLLQFYETRHADFTVMYWENTGHKALWNDDILKNHFNQYDWVCITDSDIELSIDTPKGFIEDMITVAKDYRVDKCGLAIKYKGISNQYLRNIIEPIEAKYWKHKLQHLSHSVYDAQVDTTLCVVRPDQPFTYTAVRLADWPIKHMDWYIDFDNLTPEQQFYMDNANEQVSTTKQHYLNYLKSK